MNKTSNDLIGTIIKRFTSAKTERKQYEDLWRSCFNYSFPIRSTGFNGEVVSGSTVKDQNARLYDSTLTDSARTQASAIISGLTPANSVWFDLEINGIEVNDEAKRWLSSAAKIIWKNIHNSNFDAAAYEGMLDMMAAGWFAMYIDSDRDLGGYVFELWPLSSVYCSASQAGGAVDTVYRYFELTAEQISNTYEISSLGADFEASLKNDPSKKYKIIQAIYPRPAGEKNSLAKNKPIASVHILEDGKKLLRESGYEEMPVVIPRWMIIPQSVYATGPVSEALPDAKTLNDIKRLELMNAELAISGMWLAKDDGVLNPSTIKVKPGGIIVVNEIDSFKPLVSGVDFNISFAKCDQLQAAIRKIMLADQLQPQNGPAMTATEVNMRQQLIRQLLGPIYGRMQAEYLQPLVLRCFGIAYRAGILGDPPDVVDGQIASVRYLNPLARAQKMEEVVAINNLLQMVMGLVQVEPSVVDNLNFDVVVRYTGESLGAPNETIRPIDEVQALREQRAEMQKMQQEQAMQQQIAMTGAGAAAQAAGQKAGEQVDEQ